MNCTLTYFLIIAIVLQLGKFERLNPQEMKQFLSVVKVSSNDVPEKCSLALQGKWYPETKYTYMYCNANLIVNNKPDLEKCNGFDCWESQLTDATRNEILDIMNQYRQKVAKDTCTDWCEGYRNRNRVVFELRWNHTLELNATHEVRTCERSVDKSERTNVIYPFRQMREVHRDIVVTSFETKTGLQREMRSILWKLMTENHLKDWNHISGQFRRGGMIDVGCAYVLRRQVNYKTALNEVVKSGNVGHLACIFTSPTNLEVEIGQPSTEICKSTTSIFSVEFSEQNNYPSLCKIHLPINKNTAKSPSQSCHREPNSEASKKAQICAQSSKFSATTWKEKHYGMILKLQNSDTLQAEAACNVPESLPKPTGANSVFYCTLKHEVFLEVDPDPCSMWNCEDSQLTDVAKIDILKNLNEARNLVANKKCSPECPLPCEYCNNSYEYCNMATLRWHWFLEWKASQIVRTCPETNSYQIARFDDAPFSDPVYFEKTTTVFDLPASEGQLALGRFVSKMFWQNTFYDWEDDNKFRRANFLLVGCSIVIRPNGTAFINPSLKIVNGSATHMACVYAALDSTFKSTIGSPNDQSCCPTCTHRITPNNPCLMKFVKNISPFANLCTSTLQEITASCQVNYCNDGSVSKIWHTIFDNVTVVYEAVDGSFHVIGPPLDHRLFCIILTILFLLLLLIYFIVLLIIYAYMRDKKMMKKPQDEMKPKLKTMPKTIIEKKTTKPTKQRLSTTRKPKTEKPRHRATTSKFPTTRKLTTKPSKFPTTRKPTTKPPVAIKHKTVATQKPKPVETTTRKVRTTRPPPTFEPSPASWKAKLLTKKPTTKK